MAIRDAVQFKFEPSAKYWAGLANLCFMIQCASSQLFSWYADQAGNLYQVEIAKTFFLLLVSCWVAYKISKGQLTAHWFGFQLFAMVFLFSPRTVVGLLGWMFSVYMTYKTTLSDTADRAETMRALKQNLLR